MTGHPGSRGASRTRERTAGAQCTTSPCSTRGAISVTERQRYIGRLRAMARTVAEAWLAWREALGFPLLWAGEKALRQSAEAVVAALDRRTSAAAARWKSHAPAKMQLDGGTIP